MSAEAVEAVEALQAPQPTTEHWALSSFITTSWVNLIHVYLRSFFFFICFYFFSHNFSVYLASACCCSVACLLCECMALCTNQIDVECMNCAENSFCHAHNNALWMDGWMCAQFSCCGTAVAIAIIVAAVDISWYSFSCVDSNPPVKLTPSNNVYISIYVYSINFGQFQLDYYLFTARFAHQCHMLLSIVQ